MASAEYHFVEEDIADITMASQDNSSEHEQDSNRETERLTFTSDGNALGSSASSDKNDSLKLKDSTHATSQPNAAIDSSPEGRRKRTVTLFSITAILLFADQNLLSPNLTAIANEFDFSVEERDRKLGGDIALAFFLLGAPASFLIGCLADQSDRSLLFAWTVGIGEGACFATFWTRTYTQLYVCRAITGFSIGGAVPLIYSVLGDLFGAEDRHAVSAVIGIGTGVGIAFGQGVAGFLGPTFGWRVPFLVVSIPALICAALVLFTVPDPERGSMERAVINMKLHLMECNVIAPCDDDGSGVEMTKFNQSIGSDDGLYAETSEAVPDAAARDVKRRAMSGGSQSGSIQSPLESDREEDQRNSDHSAMGPYSRQNSATSWTCGQDWRSHFMTLLSLLSCPTVILTFLQGAPGCLPWGIVNSFLNDFLAEDRGMTVEGATATVLCFGLGNFFGLLVGGAGGRHLYSLDPRYPALLAGFSAVLGCIPFWLLLNTIDESSPFLYVGAITLLGGLGTGVTGPIVKATLQNVTLPTTRGQAFAIYNLFDDFGRGLGPVFVSLLIVNMGGRTPAFNLGVFGWVICGILNLLIYFTVDHDERKTQATLAASLHYVPFATREQESMISPNEKSNGDVRTPVV